MKRKITLLGVLVSLPSIIQAAPIPGVDLHPLLKIHENRQIVPTTPVTQSFNFDDDLLVTQNGAFLYQEIERHFLGAGFEPPVATIAVGVASTALFSSLGQALGTAQIGKLPGTLVCRLASLRPEEGYVLSWYGRTNRSTRLTLTPQAGVPDCPDAVARLLQAIRSFKEGVLADPATQVFTSS